MLYPSEQKGITNQEIEHQREVAIGLLRKFGVDSQEYLLSEHAINTTYREARRDIERELDVKLNMSECIRLRRYVVDSNRGLIGTHGSKHWYKASSEAMARFLTSEYGLGNDDVQKLVAGEKNRVRGGFLALLKQIHFVRRKREEDGSL